MSALQKSHFYFDHVNRPIQDTNSLLMIKTKVAFMECRLLSSQSVQFEKFLKSSGWLKKAGAPKKPLLF